MTYVYVAIVILSAIYIFLVRYKDKKPEFVKAIFVILFLIMLVELSIQALTRHINKVGYRTNSIVYTQNELTIAVTALSSLAHWIYASKYFEVAINTNLYLSQTVE